MRKNTYTQKELITTFKNGKPTNVQIIPEYKIIEIYNIPRIKRTRGKE